MASFAGDSTNKLSQNSGDLVVSQTSTTTSLTWMRQPQRVRSVGDVHGHRGRRLARLGHADGYVNFLDGTTTIGTGIALNSSGVATFSTSTLTVSGSPLSITAVYSGDTNFTTSTSNAVSQVVNS